MILTSSAVTPVAVAPPLSPVNGSTHWGTTATGSLMRPRSVSQSSPQSIVSTVPSASAFCQVIGPLSSSWSLLATSPWAASPVWVSPESPVSPPKITTTAPMATTMATNGA